MIDPLFQPVAIGSLELKNRIAGEGGQERIPAGGVILAVSTLACNPLEKGTAGLKIICKVAGDATKPATVFEAGHQGYRAGMSKP